MVFQYVGGMGSVIMCSSNTLPFVSFNMEQDNNTDIEAWRGQEKMTWFLGTHWKAPVTRMGNNLTFKLAEINGKPYSKLLVDFNDQIIKNLTVRLSEVKKKCFVTC